MLPAAPFTAAVKRMVATGVLSAAFLVAATAALVASWTLGALAVSVRARDFAASPGSATPTNSGAMELPASPTVRAVTTTSCRVAEAGAASAALDALGCAVEDDDALTEDALTDDALTEDADREDELDDDDDTLPDDAEALASSKTIADKPRLKYYNAMPDRLPVRVGVRGSAHLKACHGHADTSMIPHVQLVIEKVIAYLGNPVGRLRRALAPHMHGKRDLVNGVLV